MLQYHHNHTNDEKSTQHYHYCDVSNGVELTVYVRICKHNSSSKSSPVIYLYIQQIIPTNIHSAWRGVAMRRSCTWQVVGSTLGYDIRQVELIHVYLCYQVI